MPEVAARASHRRHPLRHQKWSKFDTRWSAFSLDTVLGAAKPHAAYVLTFCDGGYATNLPLADVTNAQAWIVDTYGGNRSRLRRRPHRRAIGEGMALANTRGRFTIVS